MGWIFLLGVAVLALGSAATEYDNIPLESSSVGLSRSKSSPRPVYTASYGIAPGEYVLRSSHSNNSPSPIRGLGLLPKEQSPPQEYLDLLRQTGIEDGQPRRNQQNVKSKVIDQQYFGIQPNAPYLASGVVPSQGLNYDQPSIVSTTAFPPQRQNVIVNIATGPGYSAAIASPATSPTSTPKPDIPTGSRKVLPYSSSLSPSVSRQGAGKAVPLRYSLDYDLASLHKIGASSGKNDASSSHSGAYYKETPGTVVRGDKELLNQLAPTPSPLPFFPSYDDSNDRTKSKNADEDDKDKVEVIRLPSPRGQRPITQEELLELIRAGYDVRPAEDHSSRNQQQNLQRPSGGYQRVAPQNPLILPSSGGATAPASSTGNLRSTKTRPTSQNFGAGYQRVVPQNSLLLPSPGGAAGPASPTSNLRTSKTQPIPQNFPEQPATGYSAGGVDASYYQTSSPAPIPLIRHQNIDPQVQTYQPGTSGIQAVEQQQNYQNEAEIQPQTYTTENYVSQGYPSAPGQQQQEHQQQLAGHQSFDYPSAGQQQQEYQQINDEQGQILQHTADPQAQVYQPSVYSQSQNEPLSQPKEYVIPVPPRHKSYRARVNQVYQQSNLATAPGNDGGVTYQQALRPIPQGYSAIPTGAGVTAQGATGEGDATHGVTAHGETLSDDAYLGVSGPGLEIQRTQPRRRTSRRRQNSQRPSHITYVQPYQGDNNGYTGDNQ